MSVRHLPLCRRNHGIGAAAKAVLYVLADHADDRGATWIGEEALQEESETSRSVMYEALGKLRKAGLVRRGRVDGRLAWLLAAPNQCPDTGQVPTATSPDTGRKSPDTGLNSPDTGRRSIKKHQEAERGTSAPPLTLIPSEPAKLSRKRPETPCPAGFALTDAMRDSAAQRGMPRNVMDAQFQAFLDWADANGRRYVRWESGWLTWAGKYQNINGGRRAVPDGEVIYR